MNKLIRPLFVIILIVIFIIAFSDSYLSLSIDNLAYVLAIGIDKSDVDKLKVSFQFSTTAAISENGTSQKTPSFIKTVDAPSLSTAINLMNSYMGKQINTSHCKVIIFSEELASNGISDEVFTLINDTQIRPTSNIVVSQCDAKYYLENTKPELESLISKYYEIMPNSSTYTGFIPNATIGDFFNTLLCTSCMPYAILGNVNSSQAENIGLAAFSGDRFVRRVRCL